MTWFNFIRVLIKPLVVQRNVGSAWMLLQQHISVIDGRHTKWARNVPCYFGAITFLCPWCVRTSCWLVEMELECTTTPAIIGIILRKVFTVTRERLQPRTRFRDENSTTPRGDYGKIIGVSPFSIFLGILTYWLLQICYHPSACSRERDHLQQWSGVDKIFDELNTGKLWASYHWRQIPRYWHIGVRRSDSLFAGTFSRTRQQRLGPRQHIFDK